MQAAPPHPPPPPPPLPLTPTHNCSYIILWLARGAWDLNFYLGHDAPMTVETKGQWASLPGVLCVALMPHHQGSTSPIYLILFGPPTRAPLFMHYVKHFRLLSLFLFLHYLSPTPFLPHHPPSPIFLSLTPPSSSHPFFIFFFFLLSGPSPCFHPFRPVWTGASECVNLSEISPFLCVCVCVCS